jgi:hypothetical protein
MELHESLYALGLRLGREVFEDPDSFRGALDDFLDEDSATTGDINLLVDAVRLGAFASMTSMIGSGAQVTAAVEEAGNRLARDRGSADVAGAQWACAVLGFAIGKVSDAEVRRYRTQHATPQPPSQPLPPTQFPAQPGAAPTQRPGVPVPGGQPTAQGPLPTAQPLYAHPGSGGVPSPPVNVPPPSSWPPAPPPARKRKTWPILVAIVAVLAIIGGGAFAVITLQGDDDNGGGGGKPEVTDLPTDLEAVSERYGELAGDVGEGVDECEAVEASEGSTEALECGIPDGTLALTTYETIEDLEAGRGASISTDAGTRYSKTDAGVIYGVNNASAVSEADVASIYWDSNEGLQSATLTASSGEVTLDQLVEDVESTDPVVAWPTAPEDEGMLDLAGEFVKVDDCNRIETIQTGELEESICSAPGGITIFMGVFETFKDFKDYRRDAIQQGIDQGYPLRNWNFDGNAREGAAAEYLNSSGDAVRYWDKPECQCYMEASLTGSDDLQKLENWWVKA